MAEEKTKQGGFIKKGGVEQSPPRPEVDRILESMKPGQPIPKPQDKKDKNTTIQK